ncbi:hypothetical protein LO772_16395 [Yinghuangia sp. ASG 101]|uniref:hypothetical protein n=1 Tax=Yinghuangia sp. ASG 101 TaxID=2896848 RepID=UPI001E33C381|nr:hypothetical protein [Yinghuangia sp. ASG 101]UGQ15005.1 hypothetical protein LO772_16395 [Yinghuangia sp. ASG 101]
MTTSPPPPVDPPTVELRPVSPELPVLVRPYFRAHEQRVSERRAQRRRRVDLWLAVHGVDAGPRRVHDWVVPR